MSLHIDAAVGAIAPKVLLPGDPLRAKFIAENFLENPVCINKNRGMLGYTGTYKGKQGNTTITVMGSGMGQASLGIYVYELINDYRVKEIIRVGTCGSYQERVHVKDIIIAQSASTDAQHNKIYFQGLDFAPCSDFELLHQAYLEARVLKIKPHIGNILSSDQFYSLDSDRLSWKNWAKFNVLAVEMESNMLYTLGARFGIKTLSILTVSDSLVTGESTSKEERQNTFTTMAEIALETVGHEYPKTL